MLWIFNECMLALLLCLSSSSPSLAVTIRDQGKIFGTSGRVELGADTWSQSVTAGITGRLERIEVRIEAFAPVAGGEEVYFNFAIYEGGNPPVNPPFAWLPQTVIPRSAEESVLFDVASADLFFRRGDVFTFALSVYQQNILLAAAYSGDGSGYPSGELFKNGIAEPIHNSDMAFITYVTPDLNADFNNDLAVDDLDRDIWELNFGAIEATHALGDANGDHVVTGADFMIWQREYGLSIAEAQRGVPEPLTIDLLAIGLAAVAFVAVRPCHRIKEARR